MDTKNNLIPGKGVMKIPLQGKKGAGKYALVDAVNYRNWYQNNFLIKEVYEQ